MGAHGKLTTASALGIGAKLTAAEVDELLLDFITHDALVKEAQAEFRTAAIELHVWKHYASTGVRWEDCEECASVRAKFPEYSQD